MTTQALELKHKVDSLVVSDSDSFKAGEALRATLREAKKIALAPAEEAAAERHNLWKAAVGVKNDISERFDTMETRLKGKLKEYADEARLKADEEARQRAHEQRKAAEEARIAQAEDLADRGQSGAADAALTAPIVEAAVKRTEVPKVKGQRTNWKYDIVDKTAFVEACLAEKGCLNLGCLQESKMLGKLVRATNVNFKAPGVVAIAEEG